MLPLDQTFRFKRKLFWTRDRFAELPARQSNSCDRLTVSPFENPWYLLQTAKTDVHALSEPEATVVRAAYFATFPEID